LLRVEPDTLLQRIAGLAPGRHRFQLVLVAAASVHAGLVSLLGDARPLLAASTPQPATELVMDLSPPPEPAPPLEAPPPPPSLPPLRASSAPGHRPSSAPTEPARAAAVLSQADTEQPLDLTDSIVTGSAESYAGGVTSARGTAVHFSRSAGASASPSRAPASAAGAAEGPDLSSAPSVLGGLSWNCPFPPAADADAVNHAQVTIRVEVDARGRPTRVQALTDPGHGFAAAAQRCALGRQWSPGADRLGRPRASAINLNVRFVR
jgi:protein TonB